MFKEMIFSLHIEVRILRDVPAGSGRSRHDRRSARSRSEPRASKTRPQGLIFIHAEFGLQDRGRQSVCPRPSLKFPVRSNVPPKKFPVRYFTWPDSRLGDDGLPIGRAFIGFPVGAAKGAVHVAPTQRGATPSG